MPNKIGATVGFHGANRPGDVKTIQRLLNQVPVIKGGPETPLDEDGVCGKLTMTAIRRFQQAALSHSDGYINASGRSLQALLAWSTPVPGLHGGGGEKAVPLAAVNLCPATPSSYTYTQDYRENPAAGKKVTADQISWLFAILAQWEESWRGTPETQKGGYQWSGEGSSKESTAAKAAKGADIQQKDVMTILEIFGMLQSTMPNGATAAKGKDLFTQWHPYWKEAAEDPRKRAEIVENVADIMEELAEAFKAMGVDIKRLTSRSGPPGTLKSDRAPEVEKSALKRDTLYGDESKSQIGALWIWQWNFGNGVLGKVEVYEFRKQGGGSGYFYLTSAESLDKLDWKYRCLCRPLTTKEVPVPWLQNR